MESPKDDKPQKSAFDSTTFDANISIHVEKDLNDVGSATISPSGRDVAIASKSGLEIIDLDSPFNPPRYLRYGQSWLVADVQWSPFAARENWVASASNQKTLIWNLTMSEDSKQGAIEHTLHAHTRAITDINFSAHHADIISTCAVDGYVHCWDLRRPRRPVMTFCDWHAGATQVKWNRQDPHILASSHDRWLRIWDDRNGASPLISIMAHESKIYGVDWNRTRHTGIVTCSLDKSIKFWDYTKSDEDLLERVIRTDFPVWRARHTPFGWGLLAMPQDCPGNLHLYDRRKVHDVLDEATPAVEVFEGHGDKQVKEFLWRSRGGVEDGIDNREFQLVSWGTDNQLRLQQVNSKALEDVGYVKGRPVRKNLIVTRKGATYKTFRNVDHTDSEKEKEKTSRPYTTEPLTHLGLSIDAAKKMSVPRIPRRNVRNRRISRPGAKKGQINWMKGVKFDRPLLAAAGRNKTARRLSLMSPNFEAAEDWDTQESLHDEIILVHKRYSKVSFDDINMDKRSVTVSMYGPWGQSGDSTYIKVNIIFPPEYPESKAPDFVIHKSSLILDVVYDKIIAEIQQIALGFVERKRGCLEAAVCYLLGELGLEESTTLWLSQDNDAEDANGVDVLVDDSSSEDENELPPGSSATMSQELDASVSDGTAVASARHANVPLPRHCGAVFAHNGKLVCFFPPKQEKVKSLLGTLNLENDKTRSEPTFNSIGRLRDNLGSARSKFSALSEDDGDDDSDSSDGSDSSSSSSSSGSDSSRFRLGLGNFWNRPRPPFRRNLSTKGSQKSSTIGTGTGTGISKGRVQRPRNIVVLHDVGSFVPAKKELAVDYAIFGDGAEVCNHNAAVAERHGHQDRADIWRYAAMLLHHEVPLEVLDQSHRQEPILVIARTMIRRCRRPSVSDSGIDMSYDEKPKSDKISARVKWGQNPLAKHLIEDLFNHFDRLADVQMLAMLSCIFSEPSAEDPTARAEMRTNQPETPLSMKTPGFSLDYFPSDVAAWSAYQRGPYSTAASTPKAMTPTALIGSYGSYTGYLHSDPASATYSTGTTPPIRSSRGSSDRLHHIAQSHAHSLSASPEEKRSLRRGNSGLSSTFSFSRPFSATAPSSPPGRKKLSPVEQLLGTLTPNAVAWGQNTIIGYKDSGIHSRQSYSDEDIHNHYDVDHTRPITGISSIMYNQELFDDEGCMSTPLLSSPHIEFFSSYRAAYAELLFAWGLQIPRLEILKFSGLPDYFAATNALRTVDNNANPSFTASIASNEAKAITHEGEPIVLGKKDSLESKKPTDEGIDITGYCLKHDCRLSPIPKISATSGLSQGGAVGRCERCAREKRQLKCVICEEPVWAVFTPCLSCGCVSHQQCLDEYVSSSSSEVFGRCAGGCECECVSVAGKGVVEGWEVMMGAIERMRKLHPKDTSYTDEALVSADEDEDHDLEWEKIRAGSTASNSSWRRKAENGGAAAGSAVGSGNGGNSGRSTPVQQGAALAYGHLSRKLTQMRGNAPEWGKRKGSGLREA